MWLIVLIVVGMAGYFVYTLVLLPKKNEKAEEKQKSLADNFISQISGREDEVRRQYAETNGSVSPIAKQAKEDTLDGIISCMERRDMKDVTRQVLTNVAGKAVGKLVGIGFKQVDNEEHYYLALSAERLHYLHFSESGTCKEHLVFDRTRMEQLESGKVTSAEAITNSADMFSTFRLSFTYEGVPYKFFYYDKFYDHPSAGKVADEVKEFAERNYLFAEPFLRFAESFRQEES